MAAKTPRPFHKPLTEKRYRRKLRNRIYLETDRAFLDSITTTDESGRIVLARELEKDELKRLKKLRKEAKKNRGAVRTGKLITLAVLVGAIVVFNLVFKNQLAERGAESLLEQVFAARADLTGVVFRPLAGELSFASLTVADAQAPMQNLFSLGSGRLAVDTWQLVSRRVLIDDLTVSGLAFGTPREESGALGSAESGDEERREGSPTDEAPAEPAAAQTFSFAALGLPDTLDAKEFVAQQYLLLETPGKIDAIVGAGSTYVDRWQSEFTTLASQGVASADRVRDLSSTDFTRIRSVEEALGLLEDTNELVASTRTYAETVRTSVTTATSEGRVLVDSAAQIPASVRADYDFVRAMIPDVRTDGRDFLVGLIEPYLREQLGSWYDRILKGYAYFERLRADAEPGEARTAARTGTIVDFETTQYPSFAIAQGFASASGARDLELIVESVSSDPDITGEPARISYRDASGDSVFSLGAIVDRRTDAGVPLSLSVEAAGNPVSLSRGLAALDLEQFDAIVDLSLSLVRSSGTATSGTATSGMVSVSAGGIVLTGAPAARSIGELVQEVLTGPDPLLADFSYQIGADGDLSLTDGATNLDDRIGGLVRERIDATLAAFEARVENELDDVLGPELAILQDALGDVVDVQATADELLALATDREAAAAALRARADDAVASLRNAVEDEARRRLDAARAEAEAAAAAEAARAEEAARAAADRAAAEAEDAVRDQAENLRDSIRLPGF